MAKYFRKIILDTSILIDAIKQKDINDSVLMKLAEEDHELFVSTISSYEFMRGKKYPKSKKPLIMELVNEIEYCPETARISVDIYNYLKKNNKLIEDFDITIIATAIQHNLEVATLNSKHFNRYPKTKLFDLSMIDDDFSDDLSLSGERTRPTKNRTKKTNQQILEGFLSKN